MAKAKRTQRRSALSGYIRKAASMGAKVIKAGPVLFPAIKGIQDGLASGNLEVGLDHFVYEASGYSMGAHRIDTPKVTEVAVRDVVLFAIGSGLSYLARRI